jgi:hypothetical protein
MNNYELMNLFYVDGVRSQKVGLRKRLASEKFWARENVRGQFPGPPTTWRPGTPSTAKTWGNGLKRKEAHILQGLIDGGNNNPLLQKRLSRK